jgi:hypothetical protein
MGTKEKRLSGKIIGHTVKFLPKRVIHRGEGITVTQDKRIAALVTIQVDDRKIFTVPSKETEVLLESQEPSLEAKAAVYDMLIERHPFNADRVFVEYITTKSNKKASRRYELQE